MIEPIVAQTVGGETLLDALVRILGFCALSAGTAAIAAVVFRWYSADELPDGVGILLGISMVAIWLNTKSALQDALIGNSELTDPETAVYTVATFVASAVAADAGRRLGDHLATDVFAVAAPRTIDDVTQLVRSAGRVVTVDLPEEIEDIEGYDPVDPETKAELAGETLLLPRRLADEAVRDRLVDRLKRDYGIGHVDVEFGENRAIEYLAVGSRLAGIGPTLAPGTVAVALRGDPAADASPGDAVRIWRRDGDEDEVPLKRVASGELRGNADDVVTVAVDADDAPALESESEHRLVTLPKNPGAERELVSLLRAADETVTTLAIDPDGPLVGVSVGSLPVLVLAIDRDGSPIALPPSEAALEAGDVAYALGRPEALRRVTAPDR
ncbi:cation:proton antiporter regulatory subunit [Halosolutus gelatinilyticus]|uniref:cation:proton antiporter regulatory subunit n=1 Tax=Halosolutus gelatinilyticus TaxID=2931975 RepID=UPI001FF4457E|nr:TrkA C-terminal domain-containing protein [Halosolutus gelatinilyticus]